MAKFNEVELSICTVCAHLFANGEYDDGTDAAEVASKGIDRKWGADARHISVTDGGEDFSTSDCDTCGDHLHGERHNAVALLPK